MAEVTSFTAERLQDIEDAVITGGGVNSIGHLVLERADAGEVDVGSIVAPTGSVVMFASGVTPEGWLLCNGQAISRTTYAALFAAIGTTFGVGDGSTTFNVPNMDLRFPRMNAAALGTSGAATGHTHTVAAHTHTHVDHDHALDGATDIGHAIMEFISGAGPNLLAKRVTVSNYTPEIKGTMSNVTTSITETSTRGIRLGGKTATGGADASTTALTSDSTTAPNPPYLNLNFIIKT